MNKAAFLDRDGIINIDHGYVYKPQEFEFVPGIFDLCRRLTDQGYQLIVVTNQSGIARGKYTEQDFHALTDWMKLQFEQQGIVLTDVYFCPHHPEKGTGSYLQQCACRKPEPGMLLEAASQHQLDLARSLIIGDKISDMQAGRKVGLQRLILVDSTYHPGGTAEPDIEQVNSVREIAL